MYRSSRVFVERRNPEAINHTQTGGIVSFVSALSQVVRFGTRAAGPDDVWPFSSKVDASQWPGSQLLGCGTVPLVFLPGSSGVVRNR